MNAFEKVKATPASRHVGADCRPRKRRSQTASAEQRRDDVPEK
jgi:hypothetical protein